MNGVNNRIHVQPRMAPVGRVGSSSSRRTGDMKTRMDATITNGSVIHVARSPNFFECDR